jgi:hypothetical protein
MNAIKISSVSYLVGAICAKDSQDNYFWLPKEPAMKLAAYGEQGVALPDAVKDVTSNPANLEGMVNDRAARALVYQCVRAMVMAAGYRADGILARVKLGDLGGSPEILDEIARLRARATGREPDLETFLLGGVGNDARSEYKRLVENEAGRDERLEMLMDHHKYIKDAVQASWGLTHAKALSDFADKNGQRNPMIDQLIWNRAVAKVRILDQVTHGILPLAKGEFQ